MVRDPARIELFVDRLHQVWIKHPDLRFGQVLRMLLISDTKYSSILDALHYLEDDNWLELMDKVDPYVCNQHAQYDIR